MIQEFWLVKSCGWNRYIVRSVAAQIWKYDRLHFIAQMALGKRLELWHHQNTYIIIAKIARGRAKYRNFSGASRLTNQNWEYYKVNNNLWRLIMWRHTNLCCLWQKRENTNGFLKRKVLVYNASVLSPIKIQINNKTIIEFGSGRIWWIIKASVWASIISRTCSTFI